MKKRSWSECSILVQIEILLFFAIFWCMGLWNRNFGSKVTNNGRIVLQIWFNCLYAAPIAQNKEKVLVRMFNLTLDRDLIGFRYFWCIDLWNRNFGSKVTHNGRIALQIGFSCSFTTPIAQNEEKVLVRMLNCTLDQDLISFRYFWCIDLWNRNFGSKVTNNGRITLQIGFSCSFAAPIAQNEENVPVRMLNFSPNWDFIVSRYIFKYELVIWKSRVESDK